MGPERPSILHELQRPDERTLAFNSLGLGGRLEPDGAADFQAANIARAVLAENVPKEVRDNFERARKLHLYGVLEYEFFTAAGDYALLVLEGALRVRFLAFYNNEIPLTRKGVEKVLRVSTFEDVGVARGAKLRGADGAVHPLPLSGKALLAWARREQLLAGTRTKIIEGGLSEGRNHAAHPVGHTINMPPDSARTLCDVAETINKLWGHDTPGGRLFPAPLGRYPRVAAAAPDGRGACEMSLEQVPEACEHERAWDYAVFLAVEGDPLTTIGRGGHIGFTHLPGFQNTLFPCETLWHGQWKDLLGAIECGMFLDVSDTVIYLDRLFFIRISRGEIDLARSPADLLALDEPPRGQWYAVIADTPLDAWVHVRDHEPEPANGRQTCPECCVQITARRVPSKQILTIANESLQ
jgi:hypothetical protein